MCSMISGGLAGACAVSIIYPFDFARTKISTDVVSNGKQ